MVGILLLPNTAYPILADISKIKPNVTDTWCGTMSSVGLSGTSICYGFGLVCFIHASCLDLTDVQVLRVRWLQ